MLDSERKSKINLLWDKFLSGGISNPLQAIEQMSYVIFMKRKMRMLPKSKIRPF